MRTRDFVLLGLLLALLLAFAAPAWHAPQTVLFNFGDLYTYHHPLRHLVSSTLQAGRLPFWNPYIFGGLPLSANPQSALFYPVSVLAAVLPLTLALTWDCLFHLFWGALGMALLARRQGLASSCAFLLALLYSLSPFLVYRVTEGIPTLLASLSWVPWCWLAWFSGLPGLLAGVWALQFLSGHPQFLLINAVGMAAWGLWQRDSRAKAFAPLLREGLGALFLAVLQWMPTWEFLSLSLRQGWPQAFAAAYSWEPRFLWTWLFPWALGTPLDGSYSGPPSVFFETCSVSLGLVGLALGGFGLWRGSSKAPLLLVGLGIFLALGGHNPFYRQIMALGPLGLLRTPARWLFVSFWGLLLAAGCAARRLEPGFLRLAAAAVSLELALWGRAFLRPQDAAPYLRPNPALARRIAGDFRILTDPDLANPNKAMLYRAMNVNGYEAFYLAGFAEYAARSEGRPAADSSRSYLRRFDAPRMSRLGVAYFLSSSGELVPNPAALSLAYFTDASGMPLTSPLRLSRERPERWRLSGQVPAQALRLVLAQPFYPGWRARLSGRPAELEKWDGFLQALELPESLRGRPLELGLDFRPRGWLLWVGLSLFSWAAWLGLMRGRLP